MKFFDFDKDDYEYIVDKCMLNEEYQKILEYKIKGYSRITIAMELGISESTLDTMVRNLKNKIKKIMKELDK